MTHVSLDSISTSALCTRGTSHETFKSTWVSRQSTFTRLPPSFIFFQRPLFTMLNGGYFRRDLWKRRETFFLTISIACTIIIFCGLYFVCIQSRPPPQKKKKKKKKKMLRNCPLVLLFFIPTVILNSDVL